MRTPKGIRRYKKEDIEKLLGMIEEKPKPKVVLYARVSTKKQKEYLKNQIRRLEEYANFQGWQYEVIHEITSGVNENRRGLLKLLNKIKKGEVEKVIIEYPDRLARFGFEYLKFFMESFGVKLIVLNGKENEEDTNKELAEDLIAIVTSFAARIYGQRGGKNMIVIQAKLIFLNQEDKQTVLDLMRRWSSCMRFAYNRLLEGEKRADLKRKLP